MKKKLIVHQPEILSTRKKRKQRRKRGENSDAWENLRETWASAPESIPGVGIVSGDVSGATTKTTDTEDAQHGKPKRIKKRRRGIPLGDGGANEIINPPALPAGRAVTALGGGIIPGMFNDGTNRDAIVGKALPRIGRRIANNVAISGDQNPLTRDDANNNGLIFDGTWREMPDPTPGGDVSGAMGVFDNFKKPKKENARRVNNTPFTGVENLVSEQLNQVKKFESWAKQKNWFEFHRQHFDWWTFPIDRGSTAFGFKYDVSGGPIEELKKRQDYIKSVVRAAELYMLSMAWDLKKHNWIDNPDFDRGQEPIPHINGARLFKIARSLQIHGQSDEMISVREMAQSLRQAGYRIGNERFWDDPNGYSLRSSFKDNDGVTGAMAGVGINPRPYGSGNDGKPQRDPRKEVKFIAKWANIDIAAQEYFSSMRATGKAKKPTIAITFDWQDEKSRLDYIDAFRKGRLVPPLASFGKATAVPLEQTGFAEVLKDNQALLRSLGLFWGKQTKNHGALFTPFEVFITHSSSAKNPADAEGAQIRDLLGKLEKNLNEYQYWEHFEDWIRNPFSTMRDSQTGREVGVRLFFKNDREKMVAEFDKRIQELKDVIGKRYGKTVKTYSSSDDSEDESDYSSIPDYVQKEITNVIDAPSEQRLLNEPKSIKHLNDLLKDRLISVRGMENVTQGQLQSLLKDKRAEWVARKLKENPSYLKRSIFDSLTFSDYSEAVDWMDIAHSEALVNGMDPMQLGAEEIKKVYFPEEKYTIEMVDSLHEQLKSAREKGADGITGAMSISSSHIKTVDAENTTAQPRRKKSFINHVTSTPSSYISLPEPTDDLDEAVRSGRPISWLIPGQLHPMINDNYNSLVSELAKLKIDNAISLESPEHESFPDGKFSEKEIRDQDALVRSYKNIKKRHSMIFNAMLSSLGVNEDDDLNAMSYGLINRASADASRANHMQDTFNSAEMTEEILQDLSASKEDVFDGIDFNMPERVTVTVPASVLEKIFSDGRLKTQLETNTSQGAFNPDLRKMTEFSLFSIHPRAKQRPIYGTVRRGTTDETSRATAQYGAATIVLKDGVEQRTTWTQGDSLAHHSTASTLAQNKTTWDGLYNQRLHQRTIDAYFERSNMGSYGFPSNNSDWPFVEAQIHGGISTDDISHIIIDEQWFDANPEFAIPEFGQVQDGLTWMESQKWQQIAKVAENLNIPIVLLRKGLKDYDVLEEPGF